MKSVLEPEGASLLEEYIAQKPIVNFDTIDRIGGGS
jgi:hypothetical protein